MEKTHDLKRYQKQVKKLIEINKNSPPQKSEKWFTVRNTRITASSASSCLPKIEEICIPYEKLFNVKIKYNPNQCFNTYETREEFIINKCRAYFGENLFKDNIYTLHGKKFEEISTRLYRKVYNTEVLEFGLLPHPRLSWLAMSPDGVTPSGIMLEIKNPNKMYTIPSMTYFTQTQIQMEVANLDECDFLVCDVKNIDTEQEFIERIIDESQNMLIPNSCKQYKGILLNKLAEPHNSTTKYIYPPEHLNTIYDFLNWSQNTILEYQQNSIEVIPNYYIIQEWSVIRINRDREWFNIIKPYLKSTMDLIKKLQSDPQLFNDYKESIFLIRNKEYLDKQANTICLIDDIDIDIDNDNFIINTIDIDMDINIKDIDIKDIDNCLISDT
jgi:hypothetical protein